MSQQSKPANVLPGPVADLNVMFAIQSQPVALLEKHAHAAFTTAMIPPNAFPPIGRVDQFTLIPPNIAALIRQYCKNTHGSGNNIFITILPNR